ncbi:siphovirus ReqiPepy6 Gp37-like family protein [Eubacteriales bacterium OttesenSCG-928-K08]|nr:siphovirus ReqiPepy6 Gp37-like family protein [Eubacteriales bacterium OttesenSCG-928-K08]
MYDVYGRVPKNRDLFVLDTNLTQVGLIPKYTSFTFERSHWGVGKFTLVLPEQAMDADKLAEGRIICMGMSDARAGIIRKIQADDDRNTDNITVSGFMLKGAARLRIIVPPTQTEDPNALGWDRVQGTAEDVYRHYAARHMIAPVDDNRRLPGIVLDDIADPPRGIITPWQCQHNEKLHEVFAEIGEWTGMGWDIRLDEKNKRMVFVVVPGRDKTTTNTDGNSPVIFTPAMDNIISNRYTYDKSEYTNAPYIGGAGEDEDQLVLTAYMDDEGNQLEDPIAGWDRREAWISAGNVDDPEKLYFEGLHKHKDTRKLIQGLEGEIIPTGSFVYGVDWDLGDIVTVVMDVLGKRLLLDTRITLVREIYERGRINVEAVVGSNSLTLADRITELNKKR